MEEIKKIIEKIFEAIGIKEPEISIKKDNFSKDKEIFDVNILLSAREESFFLENYSEGLNALQHIVRVLLNKSGSGYFVVLDINNHKEARKNELNEIAIESAKKVRRTKEPLTLEPMSSYERRIIHLKLAELPDIVTESIGEEPERRLVVRLYP
jgi:spoIIIJ-associated protein